MKIKIRLQISLLLLLLLVTSVRSTAQVHVTDNLTAAQLVARLIGENVIAFNATLTCPSGNSGTFDVVSSNLGLPGGVVLCTGNVQTNSSATGVNGTVSLGVGQTNSGSGDPDLTALIGNTTNDACILEFDFVPDVDTVSSLRFKYVFGSEEYPGFTCSQYNDVFGFLLSGPGYTPPVNIALVPGTNIPVAINSINSGTPSAGYNIGTCNSMGPGSPFPAYFVNNAAAPNTTITFDGFTTVLEAVAIVHPCDTYHMKLGIANVMDHALQSGVFLEENSFSVDSVVMRLDGIIASDSGYLVEGCTPANIVVTRDEPSPRKRKVCLSYGGTAVNGVDYPLLPDSLVIPAGGTSASLTLFPIQDGIDEPGFETIIIRRLNCCSLTPIDSVEIKIRDSLKMELLSRDTAICESSAAITLHATGDPSFTYTWSASTGELIPNEQDTLTYTMPDTTVTYTVTASFSSCPEVSRSFAVRVEPIPEVNIHIADTALCIGRPLLLSTDVEPAYFTDYTYSWSPTIGLDDPAAEAPEFFVTVHGLYPYTLTVTTPLGCSGSDSTFIDAKPALKLINVTGDFTAMYGDVVQLNAEGAKYYVWTPDKLLDYPNTATPKATATDTAYFTVLGINEWGCRDTAHVRMDIDYAMHESIPTAFSPNGDGRNDIFRPLNLKYQRIVEFRVFNRWGQEVYNDINSPAGGWDGTYKGVPQQIGVYYYLIRITTPEGILKVYKGDVTLVR